MPAGIGLGALLGLVREARALEHRPASVVVLGRGAQALAGQLVAGGEPSAVRVGGDASGAVALVVVLAAAPSPSEQEAMRRAARGGVPLVVVRNGGFAGPVPYALPGDVLDTAGDEVPVDPVADAIAAAVANEAAVPLARRLPLLRERLEQRLVGRTALVNAAIGAAPWMREAHLPLMSLAQGRMLLGLAAVRGTDLPHDPQQLAVAAGPPLAACVSAGVVLRGLYRRLPVRGPLVAALVAYAGTRALGEAARRLPPLR